MSGIVLGTGNTVNQKNPSLLHTHLVPRRQKISEQAYSKMSGCDSGGDGW